MSCPRSDTIWPYSPACAASAALTPNRVASTRSYAVGVPPRWTWPSTVTRTSLLIRFSTVDAQLGGHAGETLVAELVNPAFAQRD